MALILIFLNLKWFSCRDQDSFFTTPCITFLYLPNKPRDKHKLTKHEIHYSTLSWCHTLSHRTLQRVWKMTLYWDPQIGVLWVATAVGQQQPGLHNTATTRGTRERPGCAVAEDEQRWAAAPVTAGDTRDSSPASVGAGTPHSAVHGLTWGTHQLRKHIFRPLKSLCHLYNA